MENMKKIIGICGLEEDKITWNDITSRLFNGIEYHSLCKWHKNRDDIVRALIEDKKKNCYMYEHNGDFFDRGSDGRLIIRMPTHIEKFYDHFSNTVIYSDGIFLGEGVELLNSSIRTMAYIGEGARIINSNIISSGNKKGEGSYIGKKATIEDAVQFCKSVVGSGIENFAAYDHAYVHAAINGAIIGGATGISLGTGFQSHLTMPGDTYLIDPISKEMIDISHRDKSRTPTIIGTDCRIGGGIQIASPLIVASGQVIGCKKKDGGKTFSGLVVDGEHYYAERDFLGSGKRVVYRDDILER